MKTWPKISLILIMLCYAFVSRGYGENEQGASQSSSVNEAWLAGIGQYGDSLNSLIDGDQADLQFLHEAIGDRRLVQLGESGHGVAEFNRIKVRLIKYLHENMGFDVIAFESSMTECFYTDGSDKEKNPRQTIKAIFRVWRTEEVLELFEYIAETKRGDNPLTLAGFDFQMSNDWSERRVEIHDMVSPFDPQLAREFFAADSLFVAQMRPYDIGEIRKYVAGNEAELRSVFERLQELLSANMTELTRRSATSPLAPLFAHQTAVSMLSYFDFWLNEDQEMQIRDKAMADNVMFLLNKAYPGQKIILWAHNLHIENGSPSVTTPERGEFKSMGTVLHDLIPEKMYTMGLYMYQGNAAYVNGETYEVATHPANSLEEILHAAGTDYLFVDLLNQRTTSANDWMTTQVLTKAWGLHDEVMVPRDQYDAIIFINTVTPPVYLPK